MSTLELVVTESLNGSVVTCFAGGSTSDPQVGNLTIITAGENSSSTVIECNSIRGAQLYSYASTHRPTFHSDYC